MLVIQFNAAFVKLCWFYCFYFSASFDFCGLSIIHRTALMTLARTSDESTSTLQKQTCAMNLTRTSLLAKSFLFESCISDWSALSTRASQSWLLDTCLKESLILGCFKTNSSKPAFTYPIDRLSTHSMTSSVKAAMLVYWFCDCFEAFSRSCLITVKSDEKFPDFSSIPLSDTSFGCLPSFRSCSIRLFCP